MLCQLFFLFSFFKLHSIKRKSPQCLSGSFQLNQQGYIPACAYGVGKVIDQIQFIHTLGIPPRGPGINETVTGATPALWLVELSPARILIETRSPQGVVS